MSGVKTNYDGALIVETRPARTYPLGNMGLLYPLLGAGDKIVGGYTLTSDGFIKADAVKVVRVNNSDNGHARRQIVFSVKSILDGTGAETNNPLAVMDSVLRTFMVIYPGQTITFESDAIFNCNAVTGTSVFSVGELYYADLVNE